jgi:phosphoribosylaminoimidazolecarboxamide formyltransferase/IMP cyclohydrolase
MVSRILTNRLFEGSWDHIFKQPNGKEISYNNLVDIDAAIQLIGEFEEKMYLP